MTSARAMTFELFSPFMRKGRADEKLLKVLGIRGGGDYEGHFEKILEKNDDTRFDFYLEGTTGRRIFCDVKLAEEAFGSCADDELHREKLERHYQPYLKGHVDAKWLEPAAFCAHYEVLRQLSYLGRYPDSGCVFIFPKSNAHLMEAEKAIKQMISKSLAPRVAILYLEYLVERILEALENDAPLREHFLAFRADYINIRISI